MTTSANVIDAIETGIPTQRAAGERCDSCGHGAAVKAVWLVFFGELPLAFCDHHYNRNAEKFADKKVIRLDWGV